MIKEEKIRYTDIFMAFFRAGMLGFGGGPGMIPLLQKELVVRYQWMDDDEFGDTLALSNTMPGPIITKLAGYIGYKIGGMRGLLTAIAASVIPTVLLMIMLLGVLQSYKDVPWVQNMSQTVVPVVAVMLGTLTWSFAQQSQKALGWGVAIFLIAVSAVLLEVLGLHPAILIAVLIASVLVPFIKRVVNK